MASRTKAKGTRWESAIVAALKNFFAGRYSLVPYRPAQSGRLDVGDIGGVSPFVAQAKDWKAWEDAIREGLDGAEAQAVNAGEMYGVAIVKRARRPAGLAYAVTTLATWARVLVRLRRAEALLQAHAPEAYERHVAETLEDARRPI